jgi:tRNA(His) 5'-end guanylyltransferase
MKMFEKAETGQRFMPGIPVCARIDGRTFSSWTRGLARPYDVALVHIMREVTKTLVEETNALMGYTQSDEISLIWLQDNYKSQIFFDAKKYKMISMLASMTTAYFNKLVHPIYPQKPLAFFDCRVWQVPTLDEGANVFLWREVDATRNSIESAVRTVYSHKQVHQKNQAEMQDMMMAKGLNWNNYPDFFKRGTYIQKRYVTRKFTTDEIDKLPAKHNARTNPDLEVVRSETRILEMPIFSKVSNRVGVIFDGEDPVVRSEK